MPNYYITFTLLLVATTFIDSAYENYHSIKKKKRIERQIELKAFIIAK